MTTTKEPEAPPGEPHLTANYLSDGGNDKRPSKRRIRNFTEDDRAAHRLFEKSRREAFKERLNELASLLPSLANTDPRRISKHVVVEASIDRLKFQQARCLATVSEIEALRKERDELLAEVNQWRSHYGGSEASLKQPRVVDERIARVLDTEQEAAPDNSFDPFRDYNTQSDDPGESPRDVYEESSGKKRRSSILRRQVATGPVAVFTQPQKAQLYPSRSSSSTKRVPFLEENFGRGQSTETTHISTFPAELNTIHDLPTAAPETGFIPETHSESALLDLQQLDGLGQDGTLSQFNPGQILDYPSLDALNMHAPGHISSLDELPPVPFSPTDPQNYLSTIDSSIHMGLPQQYHQQMLWYS